MSKQKPFFIIVEGPDNVGKSTLIEGIKNNYNQNIFSTLHYSNVKQNTPENTILYNIKLYQQMFNLFKNANNLDNSSFICDRSHLGELIYGPIYRSYTGEYVLDIEKEFINDDFFDNVYLITLVDSSQNLINRDDGLSLSINENKKQTEIQKFITAHSKSNIKHKLIVNVDSYGIDDLLEKVTKFIDTGIY